MATYSSTLLGFLFIFFNIDLVFSQDYDALVVIDNLPSRPSARLPHKAGEINGQINYPPTTEDGEEIEYSYLCPLETHEMAQEVEKHQVQHPDYLYFLEKNPLATQTSKCSREVKPLIIKNTEFRDLTCPTFESSGRTLYNFAFIYIKLIPNPHTSQTSEIVTLRLYDLCFNFGKQIVWTRHRVQTGSMLSGNGLPSQEIQPPYNYSTEPYSFTPLFFQRMANGYINNYQRPDIFFKMVPHMMVPQEDLALKLWKETTIHYVNTSPLWEYLIPLMKAINDGIRKAGITVSKETYNRHTQRSDHLDIYTTTLSYLYRDELVNLVKTTNYYPTPGDDFGFNIWCKFIHRESQNEGVFIFLHNLPNLPPKQIAFTSSSSNPEISYVNTECSTPVPCDIRNWSGNELPADLSNYAYCCPADNEKVKQWFDIKLDTGLNLLNIDELINRWATFDLNQLP